MKIPSKGIFIHDLYRLEAFFCLIQLYAKETKESATIDKQNFNLSALPEDMRIVFLFCQNIWEKLSKNMSLVCF